MADFGEDELGPHFFVKWRRKEFESQNFILILLFNS